MPKTFTAIVCCKSFWKSETVTSTTCEHWCMPNKFGWIVCWNRKEDMWLYYIIKLILLYHYHDVWYRHVFAEFWHRIHVHWLKTPGLMLCIPLSRMSQTCHHNFCFQKMFKINVWWAYHHDLSVARRTQLQMFCVIKSHFHNFWNHVSWQVAILRFYLCNEIVPSSKEVNILDYQIMDVRQQWSLRYLLCLD